MKRTKKNRILNKKTLVGIVIGFVSVSTIVYAATAASNVWYDNSSSKLSVTTLQGALNELWDLSDLRSLDNYIVAYTYNASSCVTGNEKTCEVTDCYIKGKTCPAGTIIDYKVNDTDIVRFHVMFDKGSSMVMQSQKNTIYNTEWGSSTTVGPTTMLPALESATAGWSNVEDQTYIMGTTIFKTNECTGCGAYDSCTTNTYTLASRTAKARMITVQEAALLGCTATKKTCPRWMYNYLKSSTSYDGNVDDSAVTNLGYFTASVNSSMGYVWMVREEGMLNGYNPPWGAPARAVIQVNKEEPTYYAFDMPTASSTTDYKSLPMNVFIAKKGSQYSVCIANDGLLCFKNNNYEGEKNRLVDTVCNGESPSTTDNYISCGNGGYTCTIYKNGNVDCSYSNGMFRASCDLYANNDGGCVAVA